MIKYVKHFVIAPITIYILFSAYLFLIQKSLVYFPDNTEFSTCDLFEKEEHKTYKNTKFYEEKWTNNNLIVFFHWNAGRACGRSYIKSILNKTNDSIIFVEYFGYSDDKNSPNIKSILNDVDNIWEYIEKSDNYKNIYISWRSIWTWPASYYASKFKTDKLLLISPYSSLNKVWANKYPFIPVKYMFSENYESEIYLKNYKNDLLVIHWEVDNVVPTKFWKELYNSVKSDNKELVLLKETNHNDIFNNKEVSEIMINYLK